ncbi:MAG: acetyl-CoA carboxylase biotin carboxyl carrier protein subunit [Bacteroidota bacterium]|nr:acetyl-CoA carboxylase biotin carboxyl carrier protein subunit [Bacteroidota bacterium]
MTKDQNKELKKSRFNSLVIEGAKYKTYFTEKFKKREKWEYPNDNKIFSDIPGTIIKINVKEGDKVSEGDKMLVLESMKMKNKLLFTKSGTVKKIYVVKEQKIPKKFLMVELE